ncbi:GGDEF domain-containing protein [Roseibium sp.]|uniref:GGDEF domain-containing protein n=1 Tax=Roseibium sp. TaxID=1936156 RepID=UPI003B525227
MNLDVKTLFMVVTQGYFTGALILGVLAVTVRSIPKTIRAGWGLWSLCLLLSGLGALLIGQRGAIPDYLSIVAANAFLTISFGLTPNATALLNNKKMPYLSLPVLGTVGWFALYSFDFFREDTFLRVIYVNVFCLIGILLCLRESLQLDRQQISSWFLTVAFVLDAVVRVSFIVPHLQQQYPSLLVSYETMHLQICMLVLIGTIVIKVVGISVSIFEIQRQQFREESEKDALTGLLNQRGFLRTASVQTEKHSLPITNYALVLMEIDDLRLIEKRYGASMMDALLKLFAQISRVSIPQDVIAGVDRNGQIALYLPQSDQTGANSYARRISKTLITKSRSASGSQVSTTMSAGIFAGTSETPLQRALEIAGNCLHQAHKNGGNKIITHEPGNKGHLKHIDADIPFARRLKSHVPNPSP